MGGYTNPNQHRYQALRRWLLTGLVCIVTVLCSGCFQYDLTLHFDHQAHGQIQQRIQLSQRTAALTAPALDTWLQAMRARVRSLGGTVTQHQPDQMILTVPFSNGSDLASCYRQLFQTDPEASLIIPGIARVPSQLTLEQANRLLAVRNHLVLDLNLRDLPQSDRWEPQLKFILQTPWGLSHIAPDSLPGQSSPQQTSWSLQPGQVHHIDVVFWVPSWLGLGSLAIALVVLLGYFLKYGLGRRRAVARAIK